MRDLTDENILVAPVDRAPPRRHPGAASADGPTSGAADAADQTEDRTDWTAGVAPREEGGGLRDPPPKVSLIDFGYAL
eukprot:9484288-Pyramimonas_sp.AAC.1